MTDAISAAGKDGRAMKPVVLMIVLSLALGAGAGAFSYSAFNSSTVQVSENAKKEPESTAKPEKRQIEIGRITQTLQDGRGGQPRHLLINPIVVLEMPANDDHAESATVSTETVKPMIRDGFVEYLSQLSVHDVSGSAGMSLVRKELARRAAARLDGHTVSGILFQDFVIQ